MTNSTRKFRPLPLLDAENDRNALFCRIFETLKNIESEHALLIPAGNDSKARTSQNFYQKQKVDVSCLLNQYHFSKPDHGTNQLQVI